MSMGGSVAEGQETALIYCAWNHCSGGHERNYRNCDQRRHALQALLMSWASLQRADMLVSWYEESG